METTNNCCGCENLSKVYTAMEVQNTVLTEIWAAIADWQSKTLEYPMLEESNFLFTSYNMGMPKEAVTAISFFDSYTPSGNENVTWNADADGSGEIVAYVVNDTEILVAGNGSGKIRLNPMCRGLFGRMNNLERIEGLDLLDASSVTHLNGMFNFCHKLVDVDLSMWKIPNLREMKGMFNACDSLETVKLPRGILDAATVSVFEGCPRLKEVDFGRGLTKLDEKAFYNCSALKQVSGLGSVTTVGESAFSGCSALKEVIGLDHVTSIGNHAFYKCIALEKLSSLGNVTSIGDYAFFYTPLLTETNLNPQNLTSIGESAFRMSGVEDTTPLDAVALTSVGPLGTRRKRWGELLESVKEVSVPNVYLDVPYPDSQLKYTELVYATNTNTDGTETELSVADAGCMGLALYHMWQIMNKDASVQYTNFEAWYKALIDTNGDFSGQSNTSSRIHELIQKAGWLYQGNVNTAGSTEKEFIISELNAGHPVMITVHGPNGDTLQAGISSLHAVAIIGSDSATGKFAIIDSGVFDTGGVISWVAYEDIFKQADPYAAGENCISWINFAPNNVAGI